MWVSVSSPFCSLWWQKIIETCFRHVILLVFLFHFSFSLVFFLTFFFLILSFLALELELSLTDNLKGEKTKRAYDDVFSSLFFAISSLKWAGKKQKWISFCWSQSIPFVPSSISLWSDDDNIKLFSLQKLCNKQIIFIYIFTSRLLNKNKGSNYLSSLKVVYVLRI